MSGKLKGYVKRFIDLCIYFRQDITVPSFIIVLYKRQVLDKIKPTGQTLSKVSDAA